MSDVVDYIKHKSSFENLDEQEKQRALKLSKFFTVIKHSTYFLMDCAVVSVAITFLFAYSSPNLIVLFFAVIWLLFRFQDYFRKLKAVKS